MLVQWVTQKFTGHADQTCMLLFKNLHHVEFLAYKLIFYTEGNYCDDAKANSAHANEDWFKMEVTEVSIPSSNIAHIICIDGLLEGSGSMHKFTTSHIKERSWVLTFFSSGSTNALIFPGFCSLSMACKRRIVNFNPRKKYYSGH